MLNRDELIEKLSRQMKEVSADLVDDDYQDAIDDVIDETGWTLPSSTPLRQYWMKRRVQRNLMFSLMTGNAKKFQAKSFSLHQKFDHYKAAVEMMDAEWEKFKEQYPEELSEVCAGNFGSVFTNGILHDSIGREYLE